MRVLRPAALAVVIVSCASASAQAADAFWTRQGPEPARAALTLPDSLRARVSENVGRAGQPLGYTYEQMLGFPPFEFRLRSVESLFRDVMAPAEYGGLLGDNLLDKAGEPAQLVYTLWAQLDARAGREWAVPATKDDWGVDWIRKGAPSREALRLALNHGLDRGGSKAEPSLPKALDSAEEAVVRLLARLVIAGHQVAPFLTPALPKEIYTAGGADPRRKPIYDLLVSPYLGDVNDDTIIVSDRRAYDAMRLWDKNYSAFGAAVFLRHLDAAMKEYGPSPSRWETARPIRLPTRLGIVELAGAGKDVHRGGAFISLDLGGDDSYQGLTGSPSTPSQPISVAVDLAGHDRYLGSGEDGNLGCGLFGLGVVLDREGHDRYEVKNGGMGFGLYGTGLLIDEKGNDEYRCEKGWAQGAAYAGVGLLLDREGDDKYSTVCMSMGFGGTMGIGALVDVSGSDDYHTADTGNESKVWQKTVSMCLGSGYGRRCDSGDGQNQGGGVGVVIEGGGNDRYHTSIFSLGSGYWWGAGIFEDRGGDDIYRCTHYCMGSGAHFAVGSFVDVSGNDRYNDRPDAVERWAAIGRDGAVVVCIDGGGDDVWGNLTGGHCDLNSYALFWERSGDDVYKRMQPFDPSQIGNRPFGSAVIYPAFRNFRDRLPNVGVFLDTAGRDAYPSGMTAAENSEWRLQPGPLFWGYGLDEG